LTWLSWQQFPIIWPRSSKCGTVTPAQVSSWPCSVQQAHYHRGSAPVRGEAFVMGQGETAIALITPRNLIGFPGVFVAVAIGVTVSCPLVTQSVLPSGVIARK
jgi:hypothetical protein